MKTIKKIAVMAMFYSTLTANVNASDAYKAEITKSKIEWIAEKVTGEHHGNINIYSGTLNIIGNKVLSGSFEIDMTSIVNTDLTDAEWNLKLVNHLKSDDFFGVTKFPKASFEITSPATFDKGSALVKGKLTIKGITKPIEFKATKQTTAEGIRFYAKITIDRTQFDIRYGSGSFFDDLGDKTIYDEFILKLNLLVVQ